MMKIYFLIFFVAIFVFNIKAGEEYCAHERNEKVFVHLQKAVFISGESLYYKAYIVNASGLNLSSPSKILYFDILDHNDKIIMNWRTNVIDNMAFGSISLSDTIKGGIYKLRAYTNWMKNASNSLYYSTNILITRITNKEPDHLFISIPEKKIKSERDMEYSILIHEDRNKDLTFQIVDNDSAEKVPFYLNLIVSSRGFILSDTILYINHGIAEISIPEKSVPAGVIEAVLYENSDLPVGYQLYYFVPDRNIGLKIKNQKKEYQKREKVEIEVEIDNLPQDETAYLSVAVNDKRSFLHALSKNNDIIQYLYVNSEMLPWETVDYYNKFSPDQINELLTTARPHDYAWNYLSKLSPSSCNYISENKGFVLKGKISDKRTGLPVVDGLITLATIDTLSLIDYCYSDSAGYFYFLLNTIHDNNTLILQLENVSDEDHNIIWDFEKEVTQGREKKIIAINLSDEDQDYMKYCREIRLINKIYNDSLERIEQSEDLLQRRNKRNFFGKPDYRVYPSDYSYFKDFDELAENILPGILFRKRKGHFYLKVYDYYNSIFLEDEGSFFLNGVPFHDAQYIATLDSKEIKYIDVMISKFYYGDLTYNGIVSVYTYDGKIPGSYFNNTIYLFENHVMNQDHNGNEHSTFMIENNKKNIPDYRQTLYWNPDIRIMGKDKVKLIFYTSDLESIYHIHIQGITENGIPLQASDSFEVKK